MPFAVVGANTMVEVSGKKIRGRQYPWGIVEVENPKHCDFVKIRTMLITHMQDLQEVTHDVHYENYRSNRLASNDGGAKAASNGAGAAVPPTPIRKAAMDEKDKQLLEKETELKRMQDMVAKMQQQIKQQSVSSLVSVATSDL